MVAEKKRVLRVSAIDSIAESSSREPACFFYLSFLGESFILVGGPMFRPRCVEGFASAKRCFAAHVPACAPDEVPLQHMLHGMFPIFLFSFLFFSLLSFVSISYLSD